MWACGGQRGGVCGPGESRGGVWECSGHCEDRGAVWAWCVDKWDCGLRGFRLVRKLSLCNVGKVLERSQFGYD